MQRPLGAKPNLGVKGNIRLSIHVLQEDCSEGMQHNWALELPASSHRVQQQHLPAMATQQLQRQWWPLCLYQTSHLHLPHL